MPPALLNPRRRHERDTATTLLRSVPRLVKLCALMRIVGRYISVSLEVEDGVRLICKIGNPGDPQVAAASFDDRALVIDHALKCLSPVPETVIEPWFDQSCRHCHRWCRRSTGTDPRES